MPLWVRLGEYAQCSEDVIAGAHADGVCGVPCDYSGQDAIVEHRAVGVLVVALVWYRGAEWIIVRERDLREVGEAATSGSLGGRTEDDDHAASDPHLHKPFKQIQHATVSRCCQAMPAISFLV